MLKEGRQYSDETILQVVELHEDEIGNLHSLHCQTVSMSATISKHYLPHLSAITTFYSVEYVAKVITISRINSEKNLQFKPLHKN